jgi:hypothetical protein
MEILVYLPILLLNYQNHEGRSEITCNEGNRLSDGKNRLKTRSGNGSLTRGKGEPKWGLSPFIWRFFISTNLSTQHVLPHGFGNASS